MNIEEREAIKEGFDLIIKTWCQTCNHTTCKKECLYFHKALEGDLDTLKKWAEEAKARPKPRTIRVERFDGKLRYELSPDSNDKIYVDGKEVKVV